MWAGFGPARSNAMGRIKTNAMKKLARQAIAHSDDSFGPDFSKNKQALQGMAPIKSKKIRNMVSGYITRVTKRATRAKEAQSAAKAKEDEQAAPEGEQQEQE